MKRNIFILIGLLISGLVIAQAAPSTIILKNRTQEDIQNRVLGLLWKDIVRHYHISDTALFALETKDGKEIPIQFEYHTDGTIAKVLTLISIPAKGRTILTIIKRKRAPYPSLVYGRYIPERKDDFAWENNKIAFRMYGKALQSTTENAHGIDVWVKRTNRLVINDWYKKNDYHTDHGEGLDFYSVGTTMGAGNIAPYLSDTVYYPGNYTSWKILEQGPLRFRFRLTYDSFTYKGVRVALEKEIELSAGEQFNKITVSLGSLKKIRVPLAVGIALRKEGGNFYYDSQLRIATYWEPAHVSHGTIGIGILLGRKVDVLSTKSQKLFVSTINTREKMVYFAGATWDQQGDYRSSSEWNKATRQFFARQKGESSIKILYQTKNRAKS
jgi:hypothetical protein